MLVSIAQAQTIPDNIKSAFKGTWAYEQYGHTNTIVIKFEKGKNYATFLDIGTGEAPTETFQAKVKKNLLFIPAQHHKNDVNIEMEVIKGKLYFRQQLVIWDAEGNAIPTKSNFKTEQIFKRVKP
ncbi:hypothetical protein [Pedobacter xixiisoli]|nr:hypothetical protein [Pedobacter xixiisoli]